MCDIFKKKKFCTRVRTFSQFHKLFILEFRFFFANAKKKNFQMWSYIFETTKLFLLDKLYINDTQTQHIFAGFGMQSYKTT